MGVPVSVPSVQADPCVGNALPESPVKGEPGTFPAVRGWRAAGTRSGGAGAAEARRCRRQRRCREARAVAGEAGRRRGVTASFLPWGEASAGPQLRQQRHVAAPPRGTGQLAAGSPAESRGLLSPRPRGLPAAGGERPERGALSFAGARPRSGSVDAVGRMWAGARPPHQGGSRQARAAALEPRGMQEGPPQGRCCGGAVSPRGHPGGSPLWRGV